MKTSLIAGLAGILLLLGGVFSLSEAAPVGSTAEFMVIDNYGTGTSGDGSVTLSFISTFSGLEFETSGGSWNPVSLTAIFPGIYVGSLLVTTGVGQSENVYFQRIDGSTTSSTATMVFSGPDNTLWNSVLLNFNYSLPNNMSGLLSATPGQGDHVAPVPIPASLWILGSGLLGLVGIRKKITLH